MNKKATIRDVAKHANVSTATVSYVLNNVKKVSEKTRKKVMNSIDELNYFRDFTAISLSKKRSYLIGIMFPLSQDNHLAADIMKENHYYSEFVSGVEMIARENGFDTLIAGVGKPEECKDWVKKRNLDGLIFLGAFPQQLYQEIKNIGIPIILIDTYEKHTDLFYNVKIDDELGGRLATQHLVKLGHRNIAFVATSLELSPVDRKRYQGYKKTLQEANIHLNDKLTFESTDISFRDGKKVGQMILQSDQKITAIVTVSDILAIGIIKALQMKEKHVPGDYSIVGFDDINISQFTTPSLTTINQNVFKKGEVAADLLINSIENPAATSEERIIKLPVKLIERESTINYE